MERIADTRISKPLARIYTSMNEKISYREILAVGTVLLLGLFLRAYELDTRPGYEMDEPVYGYIAEHTHTFGFPALKGEGDTAPQVFLYHPPFDSMLKSAWLSVVPGDPVTSGRTLSVVAASFALFLLYALMRSMLGKRVATLVLFLLATDGWLIFTNRLNLMENVALPLTILGMLAYGFAIRSRKGFSFILAGVLLAAAMLYKHTGAYLLLIPALYYFFTREETRKHRNLYISAAITIAVYVAAMLLLWGDVYVQQTWVQVQRVLGVLDSRGLNITLSQAASAVVQTYWIYITTLSVLMLGLATVLWHTIRFIKTKQAPIHPLLLSWSLASTVFLACIGIKAPHYLIIALVPLYIYIGAVLLTKLSHRTVLILMLMVCIINMFTWHTRFYVQEDNALAQTYTYMNKMVPDRYNVLTEEAVGVGIKQHYYRLDAHTSKEDLDQIQPEYIVLYTTATQHAPSSDALEEIIKQSELVKTIHGFKETIFIYKTPATD